MTCHNHIGADIYTIQNNTSIVQPKGTHLLYMSTNIHCRLHGSHSLNNCFCTQELCDHLGIENSQITPGTAGQCIRIVLSKQVNPKS